MKKDETKKKRGHEKNAWKTKKKKMEMKKRKRKGRETKKMKKGDSITNVNK
jgi:hypothetical protein